MVVALTPAEPLCIKLCLGQGVGPELLESDVHAKYEPVIENMCQAGFKCS